MRRTDAGPRIADLVTRTGRPGRDGILGSMPAARRFLSYVVLAASLLGVLGSAAGSAVAPAMSLDQLAAEADVIFKGTAVQSRPVQDPWFNPVWNFRAHQTEFRVISVLKGEPATPGQRLSFHHYDRDTSRDGEPPASPQSYHFEPGRSYLVFAKRGGAGGSLRQLSSVPAQRSAQGMLMCADDRPLRAPTLSAVIWTELLALLKSVRSDDVRYALSELDALSDPNEGRPGPRDFDRREVLAVVHGLMTHPNSEVAQAAIAIIGAGSPYLFDHLAVYWLATVGSAELPGIGKLNPARKNVGGTLYRSELVSIARGQAATKTRALAVRALGLVRTPDLGPALSAWLTDAQPAVRAAATLLLADTAAADTPQRLTALAREGAIEVRVAAARAVGFCACTELAPLVSGLLADTSDQVRQAAAMTLLSFSPRDERIARIFSTQLANAEFAPLFLNALAGMNAEPHVDALARAVTEKTAPRNFWGGQIPAFRSWELLFKYLQTRSREQLQSGKLDRLLDAMEAVGQYSSSEPRDIYAFYLQRGLIERAKRYRDKAKKAASYDLDYYFQMVDKDPTQYTRS